jgi:hypothetical protein
MKWNLWTSRSQNISFFSSTKGVGDGENKVAAELNCSVLGQNSPYDMKALIEGVEVACDVKKLDNFTFNTGVKGRDAVREVRDNITSIFNLFGIVQNLPYFTEEEQKSIAHFKHVSPDELSSSNIDRLQKNLQMLHEKHDSFKACFPEMPTTNINGVNLNIAIDKYYKTLCLELNQPLPPEYQCYKDELDFVVLLSSHAYVRNPSEFRESLDRLGPNIFKDVKLIFVDETKGYCVWDDIHSIKFERITRAHPRFRIINL